MNESSLYVVDWFFQYELENITQICSASVLRAVRW
jgi:hypothetical protein